MGAVRLVLEHRGEYRSAAAALGVIASKLGGSPDRLRVWVRLRPRAGGAQPGQTRFETGRSKELERQICELRQVNAILKPTSAHFAVVRTAARHRFGAACSG